MSPSKDDLDDGLDNLKEYLQEDRKNSPSMTHKDPDKQYFRWTKEH